MKANATDEKIILEFREKFGYANKRQAQDGIVVSGRVIEAFLLSKLKQEREEVIEDLSGFIQHDRDCILSNWSAGRPTKDGGYESKIGGKWYQSRPIDKTPKCDCGLQEILSQEQKGKV